VNPGELRELRISVSYKNLRPGRSYVGFWLLANQVYIVAVHVQPPESTG
jgi:hypothetical protein